MEEAQPISDLQLLDDEVQERSQLLMDAVTDLYKGLQRGLSSVQETTDDINEAYSQASEAFLQLEEAIEEENQIALTGSLEELAEAKKKTDIKFKGTIASNANAAKTVSKGANKNVQVLSPERIEKAVNYIRRHQKWLDDHGITTVTEISAFERINHDFKLSAMDFAAIV